jgi:hypothetical protein
MDLVGALIAMLIYFAPTIVAYNRRHMSSGAIFLLNVFLGWTVIGWILSLIWSFTGNTRANAERYSRMQTPQIVINNVSTAPVENASGDKRS